MFLTMCPEWFCLKKKKSWSVLKRHKTRAILRQKKTGHVIHSAHAEYFLIAVSVLNFYVDFFL